MYLALVAMTVRLLSSSICLSRSAEYLASMQSTEEPGDLLDVRASLQVSQHIPHSYNAVSSMLSQPLLDRLSFGDTLHRSCRHWLLAEQGDRGKRLDQSKFCVAPRCRLTAKLRGNAQNSQPGMADMSTGLNTLHLAIFVD